MCVRASCLAQHSVPSITVQHSTTGHSTVQQDTAQYSTHSTMLRLVLLCVLELLLLPLQLLALLAFAVSLRTRSMPRGISGTANIPFLFRLFLDRAGARLDPACAAIAPHLPSWSPFIAFGLGSLGKAIKWSGTPLVRHLQYPPSVPVLLEFYLLIRTGFLDAKLAAALGEGAKTGDYTGRDLHSDTHTDTYSNTGARSDRRKEARGEGERGAKREIKQVVILGAGWDTRAWGGFRRRKGVRFFEVDAPATHAAKCRAVRAAGLDRWSSQSQVTFVTCDFTEKTWLEALRDHGFDPSLPSFVLCEGLLYYLPHADVTGLLSQVGQLAPGSQLAFDFFSEELILCEPPLRRLGGICAWVLNGFFREPLLFGIPTAGAVPVESHVEKLLSRHGLKLKEMRLVRRKVVPLAGLVLAER